MNTEDYDKPEAEERWCNSQRENVANYLRTQTFTIGRIGEWPAWHVAPYISLWAIESATQTDSIAYWVISGDVPTDYISATEIQPPQHPRKAIRIIANRWLKLVEAWKAGHDEFEGFSIPGSHSPQELAPLLSSRAKMLLEFSEDDSIWGSE